jgi:transposase
MDDQHDRKRQALRRHRSLHSRPQRVRDPLFAADSEFFDSRDLVQVKYEMLRRVRVDGVTVTEAAKAFGFSRVAYYQVRAAFEAEGLAGLLPERRGPRSASKLTGEVMAFIDRQRAIDPSVPSSELAGRLREQRGISIHPRSIERALQRRAKKGRQSEPT